MKKFLLTSVLTVVCFIGMLAVISSQSLSAEQVRQVYISIQSGK